MNKEEFAKALKDIPTDKEVGWTHEPPSGTYLCGCPWKGDIIPHYCPTHHQPVVFEIREPRK